MVILFIRIVVSGGCIEPTCTLFSTENDAATRALEAWAYKEEVIISFRKIVAPKWNILKRICVSYVRCNSLYSRSYAKDVASVTSSASQSPHSFKSVFICLFVLSACLALSRTCPVPYGVARYNDIV